MQISRYNRSVWLLSVSLVGVASCVQIDTGDYEGLWAVTDRGDNSPATYYQGSRWLRLASGDHTLTIGNGARVHFDVDDGRRVSLGDGYDRVSATGGDSALNLLTRDVLVDVGDYAGAWSIGRVRPPSTDGVPVDDLSGTETVALVATNAANPDSTVGGQYRLSIGTESTAVSLSLPGKGVMQAGGNEGLDPGIALSLEDGSIRLANLNVSMMETTGVATPWRLRGVTAGYTEGSTELVLVPGVRFRVEANGQTADFVLGADCSVSNNPLHVGGLVFEISCPTNVFLDRHLYVAERNVEVFAPDGAAVATLAADGLQQAGDLVFSPDRSKLYVSDRADGEVYVFNSTGGVDAVLEPPAEDSYAWGLAVDSSGVLYVVGTHQVHVYRDGRYETSLPGSYPERGGVGADVTADGSRLYVGVSDRDAAGVHQWDLTASGSYLGVLGATGTDIFATHDVVAERSGELLVFYAGVVPGQGYVIRYDNEGQVVNQLLQNLHSPVGATGSVDGGFVLVEANRTEQGRDKVLRFAQDGEPMGGLAPYPQLVQPIGIAIYR